MTTSPQLLRLSPDLALPLEVATEAIGIVASRGAGKSYTSKVLCEEMAKAGIPVVVLDPLGVYYGLRSSADGKAAGLPFAILGGPHGDVPLEATSGRVIAKFVIDNRVPVVVDLSAFRKAPMRRFVTDFLDELYHRNTEPLHLVVDEADLFAPQRPGRDGFALLGVMEDVVRRGRAKGLGCTLISQRPAVLHKDVLTQVSVLIALRLSGPQDREAIKAWIESHASDSERREVLDSLPGLATGDGWFWSPSFMGVLTRFRARPAETFDSSATPKIGQSRTEPRSFAQVDLDALRDQMAEAIERAEASDPKALRRRIAELEAALAAGGREVEVVVEVCPPAVVELLESLSRVLPLIGTDLVDAHRRVEAVAASVRDASVPARVTAAPRPAPSPPTPTPAPARPSPRVPVATPTAEGADPTLSRAEKAILGVLVQHRAGRTRTQVALLSGYSVKSSSVGNALGSLRSKGYITKGAEPIMATLEGIAAAGDVDPLPSGRALLDHWMNRLGLAEKAILTALVEAWPDPLDKEQLEAATGYSKTSSSMGNSLGRLRSLDLVDGWAASDDFMAAIG